MHRDATGLLRSPQESAWSMAARLVHPGRPRFPSSGKRRNSPGVAASRTYRLARGGNGIPFAGEDGPGSTSPLAGRAWLACGT